ncbi:MAG: hypothetical protein NVSMB57_12010 [Actinomycetota bacterium]
MDSRRNLAVVAALLAVVAVVATVVSQKRPALTPQAVRTSSTQGPCITPKQPVKTPSWYPAELPMPAGSFAMEIPPPQGGLLRVIFAAKGSLRDFVIYALTTWKQQGWTMGRGEAEPGEAEDNFQKNKRYGIFRAQGIFCDQGQTWVLVVLNDPTRTAVPTPSFSRLNPSASVSPLR